ncbi:hypothetical protein BCR36DRAFT_370734 [Piromyces finnis]|uniref:Ketopantoate reductase N-terminal domain-containing protein n=1 Tax=Piromyces finnis TaxID=1754191 RepID=A0A1Y1V9J6_9FUNG|nr:hypothetical protein BCR36DRAFT_370734 [Piromyces finnis]|eukprot:ORX49726.1 hypothetical protein BCR36DRAFT_370734 [Piromyces finnis]
MADNKVKQVLIVGAGSIGRVYGYHLFKGGAKVHYYVREHHKQNLTNYPLRMHELTSSMRWFNKSTTKKFSEYTVTTDTEVASGNAPNLPDHLDYAIFAVPAYLLGQGDWLKTLVNFLNNKYSNQVYYNSPVPDETCMQRFMDLGVDKTKLISGQIGCNSFFAPLVNQKFDPRGVENAKKEDQEDNPNKVVIYNKSAAESFGELSKEAKEATDALVSILNKGGLKSKNVGGNTEYGYFCTAATPIFMGLTMHNWKLAQTASDYKNMSLVHASVCEVIKVIKKKTNNKCGFAVKSLAYLPTFMLVILYYINYLNSAYLCSYDIEAFGNAHFNTKLGGQTDHLIELITHEAQQYSVDITHFKKLIEDYKLSQKKI